MKTMTAKPARAVPGASRTETIIVGTLLALGIVGAAVGAPLGLAPKPLADVLPKAAAAIRVASDRLSLVLGTVDPLVAAATGTNNTDGQPGNPEQAVETDPDPGLAYARTTLPADDPSVEAVGAGADSCRTLISAARAALDPTQTMVATTADDKAVPRILSINDAWSLPAELDRCGDGLVAALATMKTAVVQAKDSAASARVATDNQTTRVALNAQVIAAQQLLDDSGGQVADEQLRTTLADCVTSVNAALAAPIPANWADIQAQTTHLTQAGACLAPATDALQAGLRFTGPHTGGNGRLDPATLCAVPYDQKQLFRCDAEAAWMKLNEAYKQVWGEDIPIDLSYRTYDEQVEMRAIYGGGAAVPGTSNHGWGTAVDLPDWREGGLGLEWNYGTAKYEWMKANAPAYGWINPGWAQEGGAGPAEPWHFEYVG